MPLYSKKDFAELCFTTTSDLSNYIRRGKVVLSEGELIDSSDVINAAFIVKRSQHQTKKTAKSVSLPEVKPAEEKNNDRSAKQKIAPQVAFEFPPEVKSTVHENFQTEAAIKKLTMEKTGNEIELQKLKIQKQQGEVVPTSLVKNLIAQHSKSITIAFRNGVENFLSDIAKRAGLNNEQVAELRGLLIVIINTSVDESIQVTAEGLDHIISEFTKQRGVGESE